MNNTDIETEHLILLEEGKPTCEWLKPGRKGIGSPELRLDQSID